MRPVELRNLDRRRFLTGAILCLSGLVLPEAPASAAAAGVGVVPADELFPELRTAAAVGRQYLRLHPHEASRDWLARSLFGSDRPPSGSAIGREQLLDRIRLGRQRDFRDGDLVVLDGWYFARTEARLFALISLHPA